MTAKEYLTNISRIDEEIKLLEDEILETQTRLTHITPILSGMPNGSSGDKIGNGIIKLIELKEKVNAAIDAYCDHKTAAMEVIKDIKNPVYRMILVKRYWMRKSFEVISIEMNYSYHHTCRMHGEALLEFSRIKDDKTSQL